MTDQPVALTVLLPVRNETMNLRVMLRILRAVLVMPHEIFVIFDDEADASRAVVEEMQASYPQVRPLLNRAGRGVAYAVRAGVEFGARRAHPDLCGRRGRAGAGDRRHDGSDGRRHRIRQRDPLRA